MENTLTIQMKEVDKMNLLQRLMDSPIVWLIITVIGILSAGFGLYSHFSNKSTRRIRIWASWPHKTDIPNDRSSDEQAALADWAGDKNISYYSTSIILWNSGKNSVLYTDTPESNRLGILSALPSKILKVEKLYPSDEECMFEVETNAQADACHFVFEHFDEGDGCVIKITQAVQTELYPTNLFYATGRIINGEIECGGNITFRNEKPSFKRNIRGLLILISLATVFISGLLGLVLVLLRLLIAHTNTIETLLRIDCVIFVASLCIKVFYVRKYRIPKPLGIIGGASYFI